MAAMHWACLLLPQLALDGVLRRHPQPESPLVLVEGPVHRRVLKAVNPAARALGLRPGLTLAAAHALSAGFVTVEHDPAGTRHWQELLAAWAYRFSSQVSTDLPHAIVLEVGHSLRLFGPWPRFEARLREELRELGFRHRIVAAPNPHAARILAHVNDGLAVDEAALPRALDAVPIERAGLPHEAARVLLRMGLRQLRQVRTLPRDSLARRFPPEVLDHLDTLYGQLSPPLRSYQPPDRFEARIEFDHEVETTPSLLFPLRRLTQELGAFLAGRDGGVQRFDLMLEHDPARRAVTAPMVENDLVDEGPIEHHRIAAETRHLRERSAAGGFVGTEAPKRRYESEVPVGLLAAEREPAMLFELARGRLEQARVAAPVRGLRLVAEQLPAFVPAVRDLFDARPQQAVPWEQLRERLRARLGDGAVQGLGLRADHRPECVAQGETLPRQPVAMPDLPRPGWLLTPPVPLRDRRLRILAGPERIESGWWDHHDVRRDYYLVETSQGQRAWAFCLVGHDEEGPARPDPQSLMLHGWFA